MNTALFIQMGNNAFSQGDYAGALLHYQKALELVRGDPDLLADLYGNIGNVYGTTGQKEEAIFWYRKAVGILREKEDYSRLGTTFTNIGNLYSDQGDAKQAIHFYKQGIVLLEKEERWGELGVLYGNLSLLSMKEADNEAALEYAKKWMALAGKTKDLPRLADALHRLAKAKGAMGEPEEALRLSERSHALYLQLNDEMGCAATLYHQAALHEDMGSFPMSVSCLEKVIRIDEKYNLPKLSENRQRLSRLQEKLK
jgi:tetratricopeptide (TPR) repeat protein